MDGVENKKDETLWEDTQLSGDISSTHPLNPFCEIIPLLNLPEEGELHEHMLLQPEQLPTGEGPLWDAAVCLAQSASPTQVLPCAQVLHA